MTFSLQKLSFSFIRVPLLIILALKASSLTFLQVSLQSRVFLEKALQL